MVFKALLFVYENLRVFVSAHEIFVFISYSLNMGAQLISWLG